MPIQIRRPREERSETPALWYVLARLLPVAPTEHLEGILATLSPGGSLIAARIKHELELR